MPTRGGTYPTLEEVTKWQIGLKEATDDRLGILLEAIGSDDRQAALVPTADRPTVNSGL